MKRRRIFLLKIAFVICIFSIFCASEIINKTIAANEQNVQLSIFSKPKVDIVLAKTRSKTDVSNFEKDIIEGLKNVNLDTSDVKVTAVETQKVNLATSFQWNKDVSSSIGSINITNNGQNVQMIGNRTNPGKNAIWIIPEGNQEQKFQFDYNIDFGDSFNPAGMLLRVKREGNTLTGYMLSFNKPGYDFYTNSSSSNGAIWKFIYNIGTNSSNMIKTLVKSLSINTSGTLNVLATDKEITISGGGLSETTYEIPDNDSTIGNGFGFFSDHYRHSCDSIGSFALTNINLESTTVKSFMEILKEPEWREGAYKFLVNVDDTENQELKNVTTSSEILTRLLNQNIYFVGWGNQKNNTQFTNLITYNNNNGKFINNTAYNTSITETARYIQTVVGNQQAKQTIIVNEPIRISVAPSGIDKNTIDSTWLYGKWKIDHEYTYYENNIGQFAELGKYINNLITTFDKTGKFVIKYRDLPITPREIFVHRRPVSQIIMQQADSNITLGSESYDLDKQSQNNGIAQEEWKWKEATATTWNNGKLTTIDKTKTYIIQLRVKDHQGEWSTPDSRYITRDPNALPIAKYNIMNEVTTKYENLQIKDYSYDPAGRNITSRLWEVFKNGNKIYSGSTPKINYLNDGLGTYKMSLTVTNSDNLISETFTRTFEIIDDKIAPEVVATPISSDWTTTKTVNLKFNDKGGSGYRGYKYAITDSQATPSSWSGEIAKAEDNITINQEGQKYLHIIAYDRANNVSNDRVLGPYKIDRTGPTINVTGDFTTITTEGVVTSIKTTDSLSGLKSVSVNNQALTNPGNNSIKIDTNGTYTIKAVDNIGNTSTKEIKVTNVYRNCNAGLSHPIYSSDFDACPICKLIEGLQVTKTSEVYNASQRQVSYNNPKNATIVEYYNNVKQRPTSVGNYSYDLKVVYQGKEYNTGKTGTFQITKKPINIQNIVAQNRQYDGTDKVALSGGSLVGVEEGDQIGLILPLQGTISSKNIGDYNVTVPTIALTGEKAGNYQLIHPSEDAVKVKITPRDLTITELRATSRPYNKQTAVEITNGQLNNLLEGNIDNIGFTLHGGIARSEWVGEQVVDINTIELTNNQLGNYRLIHPEPIKVQIVQKEITIRNITAKNRQYDGTNIVEIGSGDLVGLEAGDAVGYILSKTGTTASKNIGKYNVVIPTIGLTGERAVNYRLIHPAVDAVKVEIVPRQITITELKATTRPYNKKREIEVTGGQLNNLLEGNMDNIGFILHDGIARSEWVGEQIVDINTIDLTNNEIGNYVLIHPEPIKVIITQKEIKIVKLFAKERQYDGTNIVEIGGGELVGLEEGDDVGFDLSETGTVASKDIGKYEVVIPEIILTEERAPNYKLIHPEVDAVEVVIRRRELTITGLKGKDRKYDKTNVVEILGGELQNIVGEEEVRPIIPETGETPSPDIGMWEVSIEDIELEGEDSANYVLIQPEVKDILVTIAKPSKPQLHIEAFVSKINSKELQEVKPSTSIFTKKKKPEKEPEEETKEPEVIQAKATNIDEESQDEDIDKTEENLKEDLEQKPEEREVKVTYKTPKQKDVIRYNDKIYLTIRVYNEGEGNGYAKKITNNIPKGLKFSENDEINKQNGWKEVGKRTVATEKLNFQSGIENEIQNVTEKKIDYRDLTLVLEVVQKKQIDTALQDTIIIEQEDIREEEIELEEEKKEKIIPITISYSDLILENTLKEVVEVRGNEEEKHEIAPRNKKFGKVEVHAKNVEETKLKITYKIEITNQGNEKAKVDQLVEYLPPRTKFVESENPEWKQSDSNTLICETFGEVEPNKTIAKELTVYGDATELVGSKINKAVLMASDDISQRMVEEEAKKELTLPNINQKVFKTNNFSKSEMIASIKTGNEINQIWLWLVITGLTGGVLAIVAYSKHKNK